jgi:cytochrome c oxidase assembly factor CtaG/putative copper export protein
VSVQPASARLPDALPRPEADPDRAPGVLRWGTAAVAAGLLVLVTALVAGGGRPRPTPAGLPDGGEFTGWAYPVVRFVFDGSGLLTLGCLLAGVLLVPSRGPELSGAGLRCVRLAVRWAVLWIASALALFVLATSDVLGEPISSLNATTLSSFGREVELGRALLVVVAIAVLIAIAGPFVIGVRGGLVLTLLAVIGVVPPAFTGHSALAGNHDVAVSSLVAHVLAASLWVGGLTALLLVAGRTPSALTNALPRYSALALWCWLTVAYSGIANAWVRIGTWGAVGGSAYGRLVIGKVAALLVLGAFGWWMRQRVLTGLSNDVTRREARAAFGRVAAAEVTVMAATIGLAVALSRTPTPVPRNGGIPTTYAAGILGYPVPPLTFERLLTLWRPDTLVIVTVLTIGFWYLAGVRRLHRAGVPWGPGRAISFCLALVLILVALCSGVGTYGRAMFSVHMVQHMTLTMLAPILLALGAPITLALRALPAARADGPWGPREWILAVLHSQWFGVLSHPLVAFAIYIFTLYGFYFSPLFELSQRSHVAHLLVHLHFVLSGSLYFWCVLGIDPMPRRLAPPTRMLLLFASLPLHAFFGVVLLSSHTVLGADWYSSLRLSWVGDRLADQQLGGGIAWGFGEIPSILVLGAIFVQWIRSDEREARHADRRADAGDTSSLDAYNAYLARLAEHDVQR